MAADAVSVLDAAGIARAHVYGISMGGMIAQELALRYPERVDALVLGATSAGGAAATPPDRETLAFLGRRATVPDEEGRWASVPVRVQRAHAQRGRRSASARTSRAGGRTGSIPSATARSSRPRRAHDAAARLGGIAAPTLVVHGAEDRMVPPANGRALAAAIAGARLLELDDAAHLYTTDEPARRRGGARVPDARLADGSRKRPTSASASGASVV